MSGSGGSDIGSPPPSTSCATLRFDTQLASPKAAVVAQLSPGNILDVVFSQTNQQIVVAEWQGAEAGSIVDQRLTQLRNCLSQGEQFQAQVLQVGGGQVRVRVQHV